MAAAVITTGTEFHGIHPGLGLGEHIYQITTAANGEDGVTILVPCHTIKNVQLTAAEADMIAISLSYSVSGTTVTVQATAGATGDAALVDVRILAID